MAEIKNENTPTILVCIDTTNASEVALRYSCKLAKDKKFALQILAVMEASHKGLLFGAKAIGNEKRQILEAHLQKLIDSICRDIGVIPSISIREGDIVTEIVREIKGLPLCSVLVLGKSHNSQSDNTVLPKIAQRIGNKINIPLIVVPQNLSNDFIEKLA